MQRVAVVFYQERPGKVPVLEWLDDLCRKDGRGFARCHQCLDRLAEEGATLGRPHAAPLRGGIKELRVRRGNVNYRMLYFVHKGGIAVVAHGITKTKKVPADAIAVAVARRKRFEADPDAHSFAP